MALRLRCDVKGAGVSSRRNDAAGLVFGITRGHGRLRAVLHQKCELVRVVSRRPEHRVELGIGFESLRLKCDRDQTPSDSVRSVAGVAFSEPSEVRGGELRVEVRVSAWGEAHQEHIVITVLGNVRLPGNREELKVTFAPLMTSRHTGGSL